MKDYKTKKPKRNALSNALLIGAITTVICYFTAYITELALNSTIYGTLMIHAENFSFIIPTSTLTAIIIGILVFAILSSFVNAMSKLNKEKLALPRRLQVSALTVIVMYIAFHLQEGILAATKEGVFEVAILSDFSLAIPSTTLITMGLSGLVFFIMMEFVNSLPKPVKIFNGTRKKVVSGAFIRFTKDID